MEVFFFGERVARLPSQIKNQVRLDCGVSRLPAYHDEEKMCNYISLTDFTSGFVHLRIRIQDRGPLLYYNQSGILSDLFITER